MGQYFRPLTRGAPAAVLLAFTSFACSGSTPGDSGVVVTPASGGAGNASAGSPVTAMPMPGMKMMLPTGIAGTLAAPSGSGGVTGAEPRAGSVAAPGGGGGGGAGAGGVSATQPGAAGAAGMAGAGGTAAAGSPAQQGGAGAPAPGEDECGPIPTSPPEQTNAGRERGYGTIEYDVTPPNQWLAQRTEMLVPEEPPPGGTVFLWPGIQPLPGGANYQPIGNGVLQPVLTWGPSCAPGSSGGHDTWWISPVYVNVSSRDSNYRGCKGGPVIETSPAHWLALDIYLETPQWVQKVMDLETMEKTEFSIDMKGQAQARAFFVIELPGNAKPTEDVVFRKSVLTMKDPEPSACEPILRGLGDYASTARVSADGRHCCIDHIVLRAEGVPPTTMAP